MFLKIHFGAQKLMAIQNCTIKLIQVLRVFRINTVLKIYSTYFISRDYLPLDLDLQYSPS